MNQRFVLVMKESFIPVMLVLIALALLLVYAEYQSGSMANQVVVVNIADKVADDYQLDQEGDFSISSEVDDGEPGLDPRLQKARQLLKQQKWAEAEAIYQKVIQEIPSSRNYSEYASLFIKQNRLQQAEKIIQQAMNTQPVHANAYVNRGLIQIRNGNKDAAIADYQQALSMIPHHFQANYNLGVIRYRDKDYAQAVALFTQSAANAGGESKAKALYNLALSYKHQDNKQTEARKALTKAIRIKPDYIEARFALAGLRSNTDAGRKIALDDLDKVLSLRPNFAPALFRKAAIYKDAGNRKAAYSHYLQATIVNPGYSKAHFNLGLMYLEDKQLDKAENEFQTVVELEPKNASGQYQLGRCAFNRKNYSRALKFYNKALSLKKGKYPRALNSIGLTYVRMGQVEKGIEYYKKAIKINHKYHTAWYNLALSLEKVGDDIKAEQAFLTAIQYKPDYAQAWYNLGTIYIRQNQVDKAIQANEKAIESKPNYLKAQLNLAVIYTQNQQFDRAIMQYEKILEHNPSYALAWINMGIAHYLQNQLDKAREELQHGRELDPENVAALNYLALLDVKSKNYAQAIDLLKQAIAKQENDITLRLELGKTLILADQKQQAKIELNKALKLAPENEEIKQTLSNL